MAEERRAQFRGSVLTNLVDPRVLTRDILSKQARPSIPVPSMALEERRRPEPHDQHDERGAGVSVQWRREEMHDSLLGCVKNFH
jgi:hypothetical protein